MTGPRLHTTGNGYEEIRRPGLEATSDGIKHHRLLAVAWGIIDSMDDDVHVDHRVECEWLNTEQNLRSLPAVPHGHRSMRRKEEREENPLDYCRDDVKEVIR